MTLGMRIDCPINEEIKKLVAKEFGKFIYNKTINEWDDIIKIEEFDNGDTEITLDL